MIGWVYIATNQSLPGLVKVGFSTRDPSERMKELSQAGLPHNHECAYWIVCENAYQIEQSAHRALREFRHGKEWFSCDVPRAAAALMYLVPSPIRTYDAQKVKYEALRLKREQEAAAKAKADADRCAWEAQEAIDAPIRAAAEVARKDNLKGYAVSAAIAGSMAFFPPGLLVLGALGIGSLGISACKGIAKACEAAPLEPRKPPTMSEVIAQREAQRFPTPNTAWRDEDKSNVWLSKAELSKLEQESAGSVGSAAFALSAVMAGVVGVTLIIVLIASAVSR